MRVGCICVCQGTCGQRIRMRNVLELMGRNQRSVPEGARGRPQCGQDKGRGWGCEFGSCNASHGKRYSERRVLTGTLSLRRCLLLQRCAPWHVVQARPCAASTPWHSSTYVQVQGKYGRLHPVCSLSAAPGGRTHPKLPPWPRLQQQGPGPCERQGCGARWGRQARGRNGWGAQWR